MDAEGLSKIVTVNKASEVSLTLVVSVGKPLEPEKEMAMVDDNEGDPCARIVTV